MERAKERGIGSGAALGPAWLGWDQRLVPAVTA